MTLYGDPRTPLPGFDLQGYPSSLVCHPGDTLGLHLSGTGTSAVEVVRLIHGDPRPGGPGYVENSVAWHDEDVVDLHLQDIDFGSYVRIPLKLPSAIEQGLTFAAWILPTLLRPGWNAIASIWEPDDLCFGLFSAEKTLVGAVSPEGRTVEWVSAKEFVYIGEWQFVAMVFDPASGRASLYQRFMSDHPRATPHKMVASHQPVGVSSLHRSSGTLLLGALGPVHNGQTGHWAHFNGRLSSPILAPRALTEEELWSLSEGKSLQGPVIGAWDMSRHISTDRVEDVSGHGNRGVAVNMPARAVTGPGYARVVRYVREGSYSRRPQDYDAIHLHEDDLDDASWNVATEVEVPRETRSGIYAFKAKTEVEDIRIPFVVSADPPLERLVVLLPTFTWTAYASNRSPYSFTRDGFLDTGNSFYNVHSDGSPVYYVSRRRPTRTHDPRAGFEQRGAHKVTANLYLIDWLEHEGYDYDVITDDDLHNRGADVLGTCHCLVVGSHPEYWSPEMLDAFVTYLKGGGRVLYMGSEFLLWVATPDPKRPYIMEVRKSEGGDYHPPKMRPRGESEHSSVPVLGGAWAERGRHARNIVGVQVAAQAWFDVALSDQAPGFHRTSNSWKPDYAWIFEGVDEDPIGGYGLNLGSAAWMEMDAALSSEWLPGSRREVLARATNSDFWSPLAEVPAADISVLVHHNGAAVFSIGSMTWTGSLSHNDYRNGVSRVTGNVIERCLAAPLGTLVTKGSL